MATTYYVSNGEGGRYATNSIVKARAYCVKMIEKYSNVQYWYIYNSKTTPYPSSYVGFYGTPAGYGWTEGKQRIRYIYKNGKLVAGKMKYVGIGVR